MHKDVILLTSSFLLSRMPFFFMIFFTVTPFNHYFNLSGYQKIRLFIIICLQLPKQIHLYGPDGDKIVLSKSHLPIIPCNMT